MAFGNRHSDLLVTASRDAVRCWRCGGGTEAEAENGAAISEGLGGGEEPAKVRVNPKPISLSLILNPNPKVALDAEDRLVAVAVGAVVHLLQVPL